MNSKNDFTIQSTRKVQEIETMLQNFLPKQKGYQSIIMEAMSYSLLAGGKRPIIMALSIRAAVFSS